MPAPGSGQGYIDPTLRTAGSTVTINATVDPNHAVYGGTHVNWLQKTWSVYNFGYKGKTFTGGSNLTTSGRLYSFFGGILVSGKRGPAVVGDPFPIPPTGDPVPSPWGPTDVQWTAVESGWAAPAGGATLKLARLYVFYSGDINGMMTPANITFTFNGNATTPLNQYKDAKGFGTTDTGYYGSLAYDVTSQFLWANINNARIERATPTFGPRLNGMLLLLLYDDPSANKKTIFINEEADIIQYGGTWPWISETEAVAFAPFSGATIDITNVTSAQVYASALPHPDFGGILGSIGEIRFVGTTTGVEPSNWNMPNPDTFGDTAFTINLVPHLASTGNYFSIYATLLSGGAPYPAGSLIPVGAMLEIEYTNLVPTITSLSPSTAIKGSSTLTLKVTGTGFRPGTPGLDPGGGSQVIWDGNPANPITTTYISETQLNATVDASLLATTGSANITVFNPQSAIGGDGGTSNNVTFNILNLPVPTLTSITPASGTTGTTVSITNLAGANFVSTPVQPTVVLNRTGYADIIASSVNVTSSTSITCTFNLVSAATGLWNVIVTNPDGQSSTSTITFNVTPPTVTSITPASGTTGTIIDITNIAGTGFSTTGTLGVNLTRTGYTNITATNVAVPSSTQITCRFDLSGATTGPWNVVVTNPGGTIGMLPNGFTVNPPAAPTILSLNPSSATAGGTDFTIFLTGQNFTSQSEVQWNGVNRTKTYISPTNMSAAIFATDIASPGAALVMVFNPGGGGLSNIVGFTINSTNAPIITSLSPSGVNAGMGPFTLVVTGSNFLSNSVIRWNGVNRTTTYISASNLTVPITAADVSTPGTAIVTVFNPSGGGLSNEKTLSINPFNSPVITSLSPSGVNAGMGAFTLVVTGSNFLPNTTISNSTVRWNGVDRPTTYISTSNLIATINTADVATPGNATVTVYNSGGGGLSNEKTLSINPTGTPVIASINPTSATAGGSTGFTLIVTGSNFIPSSVVRWNGADRTTSYTSSTNLTATINPADIATAGTGLVNVFNPGPGWVSNTVQFQVTAQNPVPSIAGISPTSKNCGDTSFTLTVTGTNFINGSKVRWNGVEKTTTYGSATTLTAQITAADIAAAGTPEVTVVNPTPGGGTSNVVSFTVNSNPAPSLSAITPTHIMAGTDGFTLTVSGTNFNEKTTIRWRGVDRETTYLSATSLSTEIYTEDLTEDVTIAVTVFNPPCGGGASTAITFTIDPVPAPILTVIAPETITAGSDGFILEVTGSDFVEGSSVRWDGVDLDTVYISSSSLEADVPAENIGSPGAADITVFNPPPGGGTSDALTLTISAPPTSIITRVSPNRVYTGSSSFTLTVYGTDFLDGSIVQWNGIDQQTSFVSGNKLLAAISATELVSKGKATITVFTPFGGGTSNKAYVTIARAVNPVPEIKDTWPGAWKAGATGFVLTVTGSGFVTKSRVRWNGMNMYTTYLSSERLAARIPAKAVIGAGTARITVYNPPLGGGTSNTRFFPVQVINNIDPEPRHL
ncbi:MAG: DUF3344 domain-containing protein [Methanomicrobiales archaeon]|nr:DUF3344 domain-containing protein [Methanomicrobiales archaeon]